jgi:ribonucleoside-triphosphate reductase (thioredoxin)
MDISSVYTEEERKLYKIYRRKTMDLEKSILSDITVHMKYAKFIDDLQRRENWSELVTRNMNMHIKKFPSLEQEIRDTYQYVYDKKVLPSMRSMQFGGKPIEVSPNRIFNCAYAPIDDVRVFGEIMFLLLGGTGVGYSVQHHHVEKLPEIRKPSDKRTRRFLIGDSIEGWADAVKALIESYFKGSSKLRFDFSDIRPKGARLVTSGGKAPGPQPLKECLFKIEGLLDAKEDGDQLSPIEVHDIVCYIADAVLAGGIRRAALISLFSADDEEMLGAKAGAWWELNPQRGRANNSVVLMRHKIDKETFMNVWKRVEESRSGEPGFYLSNDKEWGCNPCCEIGLRPFQFCNLVEINVSDVKTQEELNARSRAASFIGTLQASYTDFHYLRPIWKRTTEKEALIGVSMTGIASGEVLKLNMSEASLEVNKENRRVAMQIGINKAARTTCVKPAGTTSLTLGTSSGIHAWHNDYYIRRLRVGKNEAIYSYLLNNLPELIEDDKFRPHDTAIISIPQKAPEGAITRHESAHDLLERIKKVSHEWVKGGHQKGSNGSQRFCYSFNQRR